MVPQRIPSPKESFALPLPHGEPTASGSDSAPPKLSHAISSLEQVRLISETMQTEAEAIHKASTIASAAAAQAAVKIYECEGSIVLTGVGKAGWIAQKLVATLASTGSPSHFLHPSEAVHGDLGRVHPRDLVIAFSNSGRSEEVVRVAQYLKTQAAGLIAVTADEDNPLAQLSDLVVPIGRHAEACPNGLAPTTSTSVMLAVGDAVALLAGRLKGFTANDFAKFHPGGALGRKLAVVDEVMRPLSECRVAPDSTPIRRAISSGKGRRSGAVMLTNNENKLTGIFTDSDLARLLQDRQETSLDDPVCNWMTCTPKSIRSGLPLGQAIEQLSLGRLSELPVVDNNDRPIGMIDITDLVAAGDMDALGPKGNDTSSDTQESTNDLPDVLRFPLEATE